MPTIFCRYIIPGLKPGTNTVTLLRFSSALICRNLAIFIFVFWPGKLSGQDHFTPVLPTGLPYIVVVDSLSAQGMPLNFPLEVGVFDADLCAGNGYYDGVETLVVTTWQGSFQPDLPGFSPGSPISFYIWGMFWDLYYEVPVEALFIQGNGTFGSSSFTLARLTVELPANSQSGDINQDELVNILDIVVLIDIILGYAIPDFTQGCAGDMDLDNSLDILDAVALVFAVLEW